MYYWIATETETKLKKIVVSELHDILDWNQNDPDYEADLNL